MKRAISIFLLLIVSLVAAQPTIAFHYCGNQLKSVEISSLEKQTSCCGKTNCCSNHLIQITTDRFQLPQQAWSVELPSLLLKPAVFVFFDDLFKKETTNTPLLLQTLFLPGGLIKHNINLHVFLCIFRI
jgi:hypothetical protein